MRGGVSIPEIPFDPRPGEEDPAGKVWEGREQQTEVAASAKALRSGSSVGRRERQPMWLEGGEQWERGPLWKRMYNSMDSISDQCPVWHTAEAQ